MNRPKTFEVAKEIAEKGLKNNPTQAEKSNFQQSLAGAYNNIGYVYGEKGDINKQIEYYLNALEIYEKIDDEVNLGICLNNIGFVYGSTGEVEKSLEYYGKALDLLKKVDNKKEIANTLRNIGYVWEMQGNVSQALEKYHEVLKIQEEDGDKAGMVRTYRFIAGIYRDLGEVKEALQHAMKSLEVSEALSYEYGKGEAYVAIGIIYHKLGDPAIKEKEASKLSGYNKALGYYSKSLEIRQKSGEKRGMSNCYNNIGNVYLKLGDLENATANIQKSLAIDESLDDKESITHGLLNLAQIALKKGDLELAEKNASKGLAIAQEIDYIKNIKNSAELLYDIYAQQNKGMKALEMHKLFIQMRDSIDNINTRKVAIEQQAKYEYETKKAQDDAEHSRQLLREQQAKEQQKVTFIILVSILALFSLIILISLIFVRQRNKARAMQSLQEKETNRRQLLEMELKSLRSQMNPHFLFNAFSSLQNHIMQGNKMEAYDYLNRFGVLIRSILNNSEDTNVNLEEELKMLKLYLDLERERFSDGFDYSIDVSDDIDQEDYFISPMLIQPYAENSIKHGFLHKEGKGHLNISVTKKEKYLTCVIEDDGIGREKAMEIKDRQKDNHRSFAMSISKRRLEILNKTEGDHFSVQMEDLYTEGKASGTKVTLHIPYTIDD